MMVLLVVVVTIVITGMAIQIVPMFEVVIIREMWFVVMEFKLWSRSEWI